MNPRADRHDRPRGEELARRGLARAALLLQKIPARVAKRLPVGPPREVDDNVLDPTLALMIGLSALVVKKDAGDMPLADARKQLRDAASLPALPKSDRIEERDLVVPGAAGDLRARLYRPRDAGTNAAGVVFFHGGGFVLGDLDSHDGVCREIARDVGAVVVAIDYRLAPEHPFPAAPDECFAAWKWITSHAKDLGLDPSRIAVAGDSAGGNLSAVVCLDAKNAGAPMPRAQLLYYPGVDMRRTLRSHRLFSNGYMLTEREIDFFVRSYLPLGGDTLDDPRASIWKAKDLRGLAPAYVVTAGFDPLRDEGRAYAKMLAEAGVPTVDAYCPSLVHGFAAFPRIVPAARRAVDDANGLLARQLG